MSTIWNDLRHAFRHLRKSPGFALTAVLTLALGIGVNAAVFTVFSKVLLHTMPVQKPGELVMLEEHSKYETGSLSTQGGDFHLYFSYPAYKYLHDNNRTLDDLAAAVPGSANLVTAKDADRVNMQLVTGNYFSVMRLRLVLGRLLTPADDVFHAGNPVAVMSEDYWKSKLGSDSAILNQVVKINGTPFTIVGIVRHSGLLDDEHPAVFLPLSMEEAVIQSDHDRLTDPLFVWAVLVGRLPAGTSRKLAETQLNVLWWNWRKEVLKTEDHHIGDKEDWLKTHLSLRSGARGVPVLEEMLGEPLKVLEGMALVVLLIACVNVANLLLVKAARKHAGTGGARSAWRQPLAHLSAGDCGRLVAGAHWRCGRSGSGLAQLQTSHSFHSGDKLSTRCTRCTDGLEGDRFLHRCGCDDEPAFQHCSGAAEYAGEPDAGAAWAIGFGDG